MNAYIIPSCKTKCPSGKADKKPAFNAGLDFWQSAALFMPDAARAPYPAYKIVQFKILQGTRRPDERSASGDVAFVISLSPLFSGLHCF
ncbi:hypothetical protein ACNKHV_05770 [Shigella flexneri]